ncbi:FAD:protein FMN transferase [Rhodovulum sulfidophilum]|uniref:FAD:protein FMN transferase n=1 Tax=Rhodovulum sulfidophilum TaxID=35806 RepID=UPI003B21A2B1
MARGFGAENALQALGARAVARSVGSRHWFDLGGRCPAHTMDQGRGAPLADSPASVTVLARAAVEADALAGAFGALSQA